MKYTVATIALATAFAAPAMAEPDCTSMDQSKPFWEVVKSFEEAGGTVSVAKITGDKCYEIYGHQNDKRVEIYFNPADGSELDREEG